MIDLRVIASRLGKLGDWPLSADIFDELKDSLRCPRCAIQMESVGSGVGCRGVVYFVVPPILVLKCPECGYTERSWA
jgi:hypothetical protein